MQKSKRGLIITLLTLIIILSISLIFLISKYRTNEKAFIKLHEDYVSIKPKADKWEKIENYSSDFLVKKKKFAIANNLVKYKSKGFISDPFSNPQNAKDYIDAYNESNNLRVLRTLQGNKEPTKSAWVDLETWCNLIKLLIEEDGDGARIYFSKYNKYGVSRTDVQRNTDDDRGKYDDRFSIVIGSTQQKYNGAGKVYHQLFYVPKNYDDIIYYHGLYNYNELCPPNVCEGADIIIPDEDEVIKKIKKD